MVRRLVPAVVICFGFASLLVAPTPTGDAAPSSDVRIGKPGAVGGGASIVTLTPARLVDTRPGAVTIDGLHVGAGTRPAGSEERVQVTGRGAVPADASGAVLNVTAVDPGADGFLTTHPCAAPLPLASSLNYTTGVNVANEIVAGLASDGSVCVYTSAATDLVIDVTGYLPSNGAITTITPTRIHDSRAGAPTDDGLSSGTGQIVYGGTSVIQVTGRAGVPMIVDAVIVNVAVVDPTLPGYATVHSCGPSTPSASTLNYVPGVNRANEVITPTAPGGEICIFSRYPVDLIVDVVGYVAAGIDHDYRSTTPARLLETRPGAPTVDGANQGEGVRPAASIYRLPITGRGGVPADAIAAIVNVTAVDPEATGYVTVHPCLPAPPITSALNFTAAVNSANEIVAALDPAGGLCVFTSATTHLLVDVVGYLQPLSTIVVEKQTLPDGRADSFEFTGDAAGAIADDERIVVTGLPPGTYSATEVVPAGWDLTDITCDDTDSSGDVGTATATFAVDVGETVTCTFTDTARGTIAVRKAVSCGLGWGCDPSMYTFSFSGDLSGTIGNGGRIVRENVVPGRYTTTEQRGGGPWTWPWNTGISCNDDNSTADHENLTAIFNVEPGEAVTCTFSNVRWSGW